MHYKDFLFFAVNSFPEMIFISLFELTGRNFTVNHSVKKVERQSLPLFSYAFRTPLPPSVPVRCKVANDLRRLPRNGSQRSSVEKVLLMGLSASSPSFDKFSPQRDRWWQRRTAWDVMPWEGNYIRYHSHYPASPFSAYSSQILKGKWSKWVPYCKLKLFREANFHHSPSGTD